MLACLSRITVLLATILFIASLASAQTTPSSRPSSGPSSADVSPLDKAKRLMEQKDYAQALVPLQKLMGVYGHDADAFSRHEVLMLVAECRLQLHRVPDSLTVLDLAAREAKKSNNWQHRAEALSLAALLRAAPKLSYAPQAGADHTPLDLTDLAQRQTAYKKLCEEKQAFCDEQIRSGRESGSLRPLMDVADAFAASRALEQVTTNATTHSDARGDLLAKWSASMIHKTMDSFSKRIDMIVAASNVTAHGRKQKGPAGLSSEQRSELSDIDATCKMAPEAIDLLDAEFARPLMADWAKNRVDAENTATRVEAILQSDQRIVRNRK